MRINHYIKNLFMLPGAALALTFQLDSNFGLITLAAARDLILTFVALCLVSSANYIVNEWLDRNFDRKHPMKNHRVASWHEFKPLNVYGLYVSVALVATFISINLNLAIQKYLLLLLIMGIIYNIEPIRLKDRHYLDVISESVNNPIRLAIGWHCLAPNTAIPISAFLSYWGVGIFLMSLKRYSEMKIIDDEELLISYRKVFAKWTPNKLLTFSFTGAMIAAFFGGILLVRHRLEYVLLFPTIILTFVQYLKMSLDLDPASYAPEKIVLKKKFAISVTMIVLVFFYSTFFDLPLIESIIGA